MLLNYWVHVCIHILVGRGWEGERSFEGDFPGFLPLYETLQSIEDVMLYPGNPLRGSTYCTGVTGQNNYW